MMFKKNLLSVSQFLKTIKEPESKEDYQFKNTIGSILSKENISAHTPILEDNLELFIEDKEFEKEANKIKGLIEDDNLVFFIGSAISHFAPSNLPTGYEMRNGILSSLKKESRKNLQKLKNI